MEFLIPLIVVVLLSCALVAYRIGFLNGKVEARKENQVREVELYRSAAIHFFTCDSPSLKEEDILNSYLRDSGNGQ